MGYFFIYAFLLIFSCSIWVNNKIIYWISYVGLMILVVFILYINIDNLRSLYEERKKYIIQSIIAAFAVICVVISGINRKKNRIVFNILLNFSTILLWCKP